MRIQNIAARCFVVNITTTGAVVLYAGTQHLASGPGAQALAILWRYRQAQAVKLTLHARLRGL